MFSGLGSCRIGAPGELGSGANFSAREPNVPSQDGNCYLTQWLKFWCFLMVQMRKCKIRPEQKEQKCLSMQNCSYTMEKNYKIHNRALASGLAPMALNQKFVTLALLC